MARFSFIARMPDEPGALGCAAGIIKRYGGNINRLQFDRRLDPCIVFFEMTASAEASEKITEELAAIGYLQRSLPSLSFLKLYACLPHTPGALHEFLQYITDARANIASIDFDDRGNHPERLTVSLNLEKSGEVERLLDALKTRYRLEILEYDTTGKSLDNTVFYIRFAQQLRALIGESEDEFLLSFLGDINHVAQELMHRGRDPRLVFEKILENGYFLRKTAGNEFYADVQRFRITDRVTLYCFQLPGGGNIYLFDAPTDQMMVDTGYGIYHEHVMEMFRKYDPGDLRRLSRIFITHADADHAGAAGHFTVPCHLHDGTLTIIERANRAYGSQREESILEEAYTKMINTLSQVTVPKQPCVLPKAPVGRRGPFSLLDRFTIGDLELEVLEGLGGHLHGQCYLCAPEQGLLFTADTVINVDHLSPERTAYNQIAVFLVLSVNADSTRAKEERSALIGIAQEIDRRLSKGGRRCLVCGGHGPVSVLDGDVLVPCGGIVRYIPSCP